MDGSVCVFSEWCTGYMFVCFLLLLQFKTWLVRPVVHKSSIRLGLHPPYLSVRFSPVSMNNLSDTKHKGSPLYFSIFRFSIFFSSLLPSLLSLCHSLFPTPGYFLSWNLPSFDLYLFIDSAFGKRKNKCSFPDESIFRFKFRLTLRHNV